MKRCRNPLRLSVHKYFIHFTLMRIVYYPCTLWPLSSFALETVVMKKSLICGMGMSLKTPINAFKGKRAELNVCGVW